MQLSYNDTDQKIQYFCKKIENDIRFEITQKSIDRVQKKLAANPHHPDLLFLAGKLAFNQNLLEEALHYFETAEACETKVATHFGYHGWTLLKLNRLLEAEVKLEKGLKIDLNDFTTNLALGLLSFDRKNYDIALDHCNRGVYSGIHEFEFLRLKAFILLELGKEISEILDIIKRAQKLGQDAELDYQFVRLLKIDGALEEAKAFTNKYVEKNPTAHYENARLLLIIEYYDEALAHAQQVKPTIENNSQLTTLIKKIETRKAKQAVKTPVVQVPIQTPTKFKQPKSDVQKISAYDEIQMYIGLEDVKRKFQNLKSTVAYQHNLDQHTFNLVEYKMPHIIFQGEKGMRQREVAILLTRIYREYNILKSDHFVEIARHQNGALNDLLTAAIDGVIYIDVHSLLEGNNLKERHANIQYVQSIIDYTCHKHVNSPYQIILSASADKLEEIFSFTPDVRQHFRNRIYFEGYSLKHVEQQFNRSMRQKGYALSPDCQNTVMAKLKELYEQKFDESNKPTIQIAENLCNILLNELTKNMMPEEGQLITLKQFDQAYPSEVVKRQFEALKPLKPNIDVKEPQSIKKSISPVKLVQDEVKTTTNVKTLSFSELHQMIQQMPTLYSVKSFCHNVIGNRDCHSDTEQLVYGQAIYIGNQIESLQPIYTLLQSQAALHASHEFITISLSELLEQQVQLSEQLVKQKQAVLVIKDLAKLHMLPHHKETIQQFIENLPQEQFFIIFHGEIDSMEILVKNETIKSMMGQQLELEVQAVTLEDKLKLTANQILEEQQLSQEALAYTIDYFSQNMRKFSNVEKLIEALQSFPVEIKKIGIFQRKQREITEQQMQAALEKKRSLK